MSLKYTDSTQYWNTIPKKCKNCAKAIYTVENNEVFYQCSIFGKFKKECDTKTKAKVLSNPEDILKSEND